MMYQMSDVDEQKLTAAVRQMVERLGTEADLWTEIAPDFCGDGYPFGLDLGRLRRRLVEIMGFDPWSGPLDRDSILRVLEGLYELASAPSEGWAHEFCGMWHPTAFDQRDGRYAFTVEVNGILSRFRTGLRMSGGKIRTLVPEAMADLAAYPLPNLDDRVRALVAKALRDFRSGLHDERVDAVLSLVQALERAKSILEPGDKKRAAGRIRDAIVPDPNFPEDVERLLEAAQKIGHEAFRHEEVGRPEIRADLVIDFWFFFYLNILRAADQAAAS